MVAVGVDACKTGWIAVALDGTDIMCHYLPTINALTAAIADATTVAIDIPIGLLDTEAREADRAARQFLGPRRNSLFMTPIRAALRAPTFLEATGLSVRSTGAGISLQSYSLAAKIFEVEDWLPIAPCPVFEVHPEVSFAVLIGQPASASKKSWTGMTERRQALSAAGISLDHVDPAVGRLGAVDDVLDAAIVAWTARRLLQGTAQSFPHPPDITDANHRPIAIWA